MLKSLWLIVECLWGVMDYELCGQWMPVTDAISHALCGWIMLRGGDMGCEVIDWWMLMGGFMGYVLNPDVARYF